MAEMEGPLHGCSSLLLHMFENFDNKKLKNKSHW